MTRDGKLNLVEYYRLAADAYNHCFNSIMNSGLYIGGLQYVPKIMGVGKNDHIEVHWQFQPTGYAIEALDSMVTAMSDGMKAGHLIEHVWNDYTEKRVMFAKKH